MKVTRMMTPGASRRRRGASRSRPGGSGETRTRLPPAMGTRHSPAQARCRPCPARPRPTSPTGFILPLHACAYITVTMNLFHASAAFLSGWRRTPAASAAAARSGGYGAITGPAPTWRAFPILARRADREALLHEEPLLVVFALVRPAQELDRALRVLGVLHHHVVERGVVAELALRAGGQRRMQDVGVQRRAFLGLELVLAVSAARRRSRRR